MQSCPPSFMKQPYKKYGMFWPKIPGRRRKNQSRETILKKNIQCGMNFQSRMCVSIRAPLWPQKNTAWDSNFQAIVWKCQTKNDVLKREWFFRAWGERFFVRSNENDFCRSLGPLGRTLVMKGRPTCITPPLGVK